MDLPTQSMTTIRTVLYRTTFGETYRVGGAAPTDHAEPWRMFCVTAPSGAWEDRAAAPGAVADVEGLVVPPVSLSRIEGQPVEEDPVPAR